jgi:1-acyl-sn-glycerol-3-phosphate acyltransferase
MSIKHFFQRVYAIYGVMVFMSLCTLLFPFYLVLLQKKEWHIYTYWVNRLWGYFTFLGIFMPVRVENRFEHKGKQQYIYVSNHTSYLDIPLISATTPHTTVFIGKASLAKIPIPTFRYIFTRLHIVVNRESKRDSFLSYKKSLEVLDSGISLAIFAEGGIKTKNPPFLAEFKDGAFRLAIEKQIPIVPVTIPHNWHIFWSESVLLKWSDVPIIYHEPLVTTGLTLADADMLKQQCFDIIQTELKKWYPDKPI